MEENKNYIIGDFEYVAKLAGTSEFHVEPVAYVGPIGPGTKVTIPDKVEYNGLTIDVWGGSRFTAPLSNKKVEKITIEEARWTVEFEDMPILRSVEVLHGEVGSIIFKNCPELKEVVFHPEVNTPVSFDTLTAPCKVTYHKGISDLEKDISGSNIHVIFSDEVERIGIIRGGHVTLGKNVKKIKALKKAEFGLKADTSVGEYELPTRIDFLSPEPPIVGAVAPGSMTVTELHVPAGALEVYMKHPQWGKAAYFVEEGGKTVDKYAAKHKARMKKLQKEREEGEAKAAEKAKTEKVKAMGSMMHSTLASQRLAKWNPGVVENSDWSSTINIPVSVGELAFCIDVPKDAPIDIWDKIVAKLEEIEAKLTK